MKSKNTKERKETKDISHLRFAIVSTDIILLRNNKGSIEYATQLVNRPPHYENILGFLGGVLHAGETSHDAMQRIIKEKSQIKDNTHFLFLPLGFYDAVNRDLRGRVVSLAHIAIIGNTTEEYGLTWKALHNKTHLAYDHNDMREDMITHLSKHLFISTLALYFLPKKFTIGEMKAIFDAIEGKTIDKRNFYKFVESLPIEATDEQKSEGRGRPAIVYTKKKHISFLLKK